MLIVGKCEGKDALVESYRCTFLSPIPDRLDGFIEPDFFERKSREWRQTQKRLADQIAEYENAAHDYVQDGVRLLELAKKAYFLFKQQNSSEKRKLLNFVCSNSTWKDQTLTATFRQPFDLLALTNTTWQRKKATGTSSSDPCPEWRRGQDSNLHSLSAGGFQDRCTTIMRPLRMVASRI